MTDFLFRNHGSVASVCAISPAAQEFAESSLHVESWQGTPALFLADHRAAVALAQQLEAEGWNVHLV